MPARSRAIDKVKVPLRVVLRMKGPEMAEEQGAWGELDADKRGSINRALQAATKDRGEIDIGLIARTLLGLRFFRYLSEDQLTRLARVVRYSRRGMRATEAPAYPSEAGEAQEQLFVILSGTATLFCSAPPRSAPEEGGDSHSPNPPGQMGEGKLPHRQERRLSSSGEKGSHVTGDKGGHVAGEKSSHVTRSPSGKHLVGLSRVPSANPRKVVGLLGPGDAFGEEAVLALQKDRAQICSSKKGVMSVAQTSQFMEVLIISDPEALRLLSGLRLGEYAFRPEFYRSMLAKAPDPAGGQASTPLGGTPSHFRRVSLSDPPQRPSALEGRVDSEIQGRSREEASGGGRTLSGASESGKLGTPSRGGSVEDPPDIEGGVLEATITVLLTCGVFVKVEREDAERLAEVVQYAEYQEDQVIFAEGDKGDYVYGVLAGKVKMYSRDVNAAAAPVPRHQAAESPEENSRAKSPPGAGSFSMAGDRPLNMAGEPKRRAGAWNIWKVAKAAHSESKRGSVSESRWTVAASAARTGVLPKQPHGSFGRAQNTQSTVEKGKAGWERARLLGKGGRSATAPGITLGVERGGGGGGGEQEECGFFGGSRFAPRGE